MILTRGENALNFVEMYVDGNQTHMYISRIMSAGFSPVLFSLFNRGSCRLVFRHNISYTHGTEIKNTALLGMSAKCKRIARGRFSAHGTRCRKCR